MLGFIYVINHRWMADSGHVLVGKTTRELETKLEELRVSASLPFSYKVLASYPVTDAGLAETLVHKALSKQRVSDSRWFRDNSRCTWKYHEVDVWGPAVIVADVAEKVLQDAGLLRELKWRVVECED